MRKHYVTESWSNIQSDLVRNGNTDPVALKPLIIRKLYVYNSSKFILAIKVNFNMPKL